MIASRLLAAILALGTTFLAASCASINTQHPQIAADTDPEAATVYIIRPQTAKTKGLADAPVHIEYQGQPLLKLSEGFYTLLRLKPSTGELRVYSETYFTNRRAGQEVWRERVYRFIAGKTYFIYIKQIDEEFRGIFYEPRLVNLAEAKRLAVETRPYGTAFDYPIDKLTDIAPPPESTTKDQGPVLPEQIYQSEPYMKKAR